MINTTKQEEYNIPTADLYIASYGINPIRDFTLENLEIVKSCTRVYAIATNPNLFSFLRRHDIEFEDITKLYAEGKPRLHIYKNISAFIIEQAINTPGICYLTYGNPMFLDEPVQFILADARNRNLITYMPPSVSFFGCNNNSPPNCHRF